MNPTKSEVRGEALRRRRATHGTGLDGPAQEALGRALSPWRDRSLAGYVPIRTEIDPWSVMAQWTATVCVPVIRGAGLPLEFHRWTPGCDMVEGPFGAAVPATPDRVEPDVLIVPLVAFDRQGYRLGYGGGFYDRTLERLRSLRPILAIGFAYAVQELETLPVELTDQPLDAVVTEEGEFWFGESSRESHERALSPLVGVGSDRSPKETMGRRQNAPQPRSDRQCREL